MCVLETESCKTQHLPLYPIFCYCKAETEAHEPEHEDNHSECSMFYRDIIYRFEGN